MNKTKRNFAGLCTRFVIACILLVVSFQIQASAQDENTVLVNGDPPLTVGMAGKVVGLLQWSLDLQFTKPQTAEIIRAIMSYWQEKNRAEMNSIIEVVATAEGLMKASEADLAKAKEMIRSSLVKSMEADKNDRLSQMVLQAYRASNAGTRTVDRTANPAKPSAANIGSDGFAGIYVGTRNFSSSMSTVQLDYVTFLPNGFVYWSLPAEGLLHFDAAVARRAFPDEWGTYRIDGNRVMVSIGNGLEYVFLISGEKLSLQPHPGSSSARTYSKLATADDLKLTGRFRRFAEDPAITFSENGTFRDEGIFRNFGTMGRPDGSTYQADGRGGNGEYFIGQNTIELRYSDGRVIRAAFTALPSDLAKRPVTGFRINYETFKLD